MNEEEPGTNDIQAIKEHRTSPLNSHQKISVSARHALGGAGGTKTNIFSH